MRTHHECACGILLVELLCSSTTSVYISEAAKLESAVRAYPVASGVTYIRWGKTSCPDKSSLVYKGRVGGSYFEARGGGANYLCLPDDPEYTDAALAAANVGSYIYGTEYDRDHLFDKSGLHNHNAPCAVCQADRRSTVIMIPARVRCPDSSWTKEYSGYIMALYQSQHRSMFTCVDHFAEAVPGMAIDTNGALFYYFGIDCHSLGHCPPYQSGKALSCVVCSK